MKETPRLTTISHQVVRALLLSVAGVFVLSIGGLYLYYTAKAIDDITDELVYEAEGTTDNIDGIRNFLSANTEEMSYALDLSEHPTEEELYRATQLFLSRRFFGWAGYEALEINLVDPDGRIAASTEAPLVGRELNDGDSRRFLQSVRENGSFTAEGFVPAYSDPTVEVLYYGTLVDHGFTLQGAVTREVYKNWIYDSYREYMSQWGDQSGFAVICDRDGFIYASAGYNRLRGETLTESVFPADFRELEPMRLYRMPYNGKNSFVMVSWDSLGDFCFINSYTVAFQMSSRNTALLSTSLLVFVVLAALFALLVALVRRIVVRGVTSIAGSLEKITGGDLEERVNVRTSVEFNSLSEGINSTVSALKELIAEEAARIDRELAYAKEIQLSALPTVFPPFPHRTEFEIYARMDTAKEVGGDFYDFYLLDGDRLAFLIADVSGKGIPAALFMMTAKTMIKNLAEENHSVHEIFTLANQRLCEGNEAGMFVTAWMCILNYRTGEAEFANAGHNYPALRHRDGSFEFLKSRAGFVLAGMEGVRYRKNEFTFAPGDEIYLYTDGVTEATDTHEELYGDDRLLAILNTVGYEDAEGLCAMVKEDVDKFVGDAPQFDDMTMVCMRYFGREQPNEQEESPSGVS